MNLPLHALNWFKLPVSNFSRAKKFYETLFDFSMPTSDMGIAKTGFLLFDMQGGAIVYSSTGCSLRLLGNYPEHGGQQGSVAFHELNNL